MGKNASYARAGSRVLLQVFLIKSVLAFAGQLFLHLWRKPLDLTAHQRRIQLKALHPNEQDLFLTIVSA
jgi:hypothetical protein